MMTTLFVLLSFIRHGDAVSLLKQGRITLNLPTSLKAFTGNGTPLTPSQYTVNFTNPSGPLAPLANGQEVILWVEGLANFTSAQVASLEYSGGPDVNSTVKDEVMLLPVEVVEEIENGENQGCTGYDKNEKALMVPMQGINKIRVNISAPTNLLSKMKFIASDPSKLSIKPETPLSTNQVLALFGVDKALGVKIHLNVNGYILTLFEVDVLKRIDKVIVIHAITEENDDVQSIPIGANAGASAVCVSAGYNGFRDTIPNGDDVIFGNNITTGPDGISNTIANGKNLVPINVTTATSLQSYLNDKTWGKQANVHFTVTRTDFVVNYDLDRNKKLADEFEISATRREDDLITTSARNSSADFNVYYVNAHEYPIGITLRAQVFTQGSAVGLNSVNNHTSHEVGHLIGRIGHDGAGIDALMYAAGLSSNPCRILRKEWRIVNY